jgi:dTDP-4-dehydrorhamnose reductase
MDVILVTGRQGQIAKALVESQGHLSFVVCNKSELDITNSESITASLDRIKPQVVVNTAAYTNVDAAEDNAEHAFLVNSLGPNLLSEACAYRGIPLIHLSTDYIFDGLSTKPVDEKVLPSPLSIYGRTKLTGEEAVRSNLAEHIILRLSGVFSGHAPCFPRSILTAALKYRELKVIDDQFTGPTSARAVANVLGKMLSRMIIREGPPWGTYHFSQQPFVSWYQFAEYILERVQTFDSRFQNVRLNCVSAFDYSARASRPLNSCLDSSKLIEELGLNWSLCNWSADVEEDLRRITKTLK